jgi:phage FluMu protein Com
MSIRFQCRQCSQLLSIAGRKAGTEIDCPKCGAVQTVPSRQAAAAAAAMANSAEARKANGEASTDASYNDQPNPVGPQPPLPPEPNSAAAPPTRSVTLPPPLPDLGAPVPSGMILYRRRTIYLQGLLLLVFVAVAFVAGYFIGSGDASLELQVARKQSTRQSVLVGGRLYYNTNTGEIAGDAGAVIVVLPAGKSPDRTLSIQGLRPWDPAPERAAESVRAIEDLGGAYQRADDSGGLSLVLPAEGQYRVLLISRHTARPDGAAIDELDLAEIKRYFYRADDLIGRYNYRWSTEEIKPGSSIEYNFGRDAGE